jgi:predicted GH43/DUF377 family glycosyl hydrolase
MRLSPRLYVKTVTFVLCCFLLPLALDFAYAQDWYNSAWVSRQPVIVNNSARNSDLTDYAVKIQLNAANFNFGQSGPNGEDLRFTDSDGTTLLNYWIQSYDAAAAKATVWASVPFIPALSTHTIYLYSSNPSAQSTSNGANTFPFFSDFNQTFKVNAPAVVPNFNRMVREPSLATPIIEAGAPGEYDQWGFREHGNVLLDTSDPDTTRRYKTWYSVVHDSIYSDRNSILAAAYSADGYHWTKQGPVTLDRFGEDPYCVKVGGTYFLYYEDKTDPHWDRVSLMTSTDAINWTFYGIVVAPDSSRPFMDRSPSSPAVWVEYGTADTTWYLYFEGKGSYNGIGTTGLATSHDGYHYSVYGTTPIIPVGTYPSYDDAGMVPDCVFKVGNQYWLNYHAQSISGASGWTVAWVTSTDLIHWTKVPSISGNKSLFDAEDPQFFWDRDGSLQGTLRTYSYASNRDAIFRTYLVRRDSTQWPYGSQWTLQQLGSNYGLASDSGGALVMSGEAFWRTGTSIASTQRWTDGISVEMKTKYQYYGNTNPVYCTVSLGAGSIEDVVGTNAQWDTPTLKSGYVFYVHSGARISRMPASGVESWLTPLWYPSAGLMQNYNIHRFVYDDADTLKWYVGDTLRSAIRDTTFRSAQKRLMIAQGEYGTGAGGEQFLDWVFVRKCVHHEPFTLVGAADLHPNVRVLSPGGGEQWKVGVPATVTWTSRYVSGPMRIELNRDYPNGNWELLADSIAITGDSSTFGVEVGEPISDHCRIRVRTVADSTLGDVSAADFRIIPNMVVLSPSGGERWMVQSTSTVLWWAVGWNGLVRVELNSHYPGGLWTILADSLPNTSIADVSVGDVPSDSCRIRVSTIGADFSAISDSDFSITYSQGYLVLVRSKQPGVAVTAWNAGVLECPAMAQDTFLLQNLGSENVAVYAAPQLTNSSFIERGGCGDYILLPPGQLGACDIILSFDIPAGDGIVTDTLLIPTDASNQQSGYVRIALSGQRITTPGSPEVTIQMTGNDAHLTWSPITQSVGGCPVSVTQYAVYSSESDGGPYQLLGSTADTTFVQTDAALSTTRQFYMVKTEASALAQTSRVAAKSAGAEPAKESAQIR